jgi:hypothetical protein
MNVLETRLEPESINLLKTSRFMSNTVRGAIGEIIAWQYLTKKLYPNFVQSLQGAIPCQAEIYDLRSPIFHVGPLTDDQRHYLDGHFRRTWDFIATTSQKPPTTYLVEVKTSGQHTSTRHPPSWRDRRKLPPTSEIEKVKRLGFTPILAKILFRENWQVNISCEQL